MSATGTTTIDFGSYPGTSEASVVVAGQTGITGASLCEAWISAVATVDHTINDHAYAAALVALSCSAPDAGNGFTIYGRCLDKMQGTFTVNWVWA